MQIFDMREYAPAFENMLHDPKQAPIITRRAEPEVCGVRGNDDSFFFFEQREMTTWTQESWMMAWPQ